MCIDIKITDLTLTPASAPDRGLRWRSDELYGPKATPQQNFGINTEIEQGDLIGLPKFESLENGYVGLYQKN